MNKYHNHFCPQHGCLHPKLPCKHFSPFVSLRQKFHSSLLSYHRMFSTFPCTSRLRQHKLHSAKVFEVRDYPHPPQHTKLSLSWFLLFAPACGSRDTQAMFLSALIKKESRPVPQRAKELISYLARCHEFKEEPRIVVSKNQTLICVCLFSERDLCYVQYFRYW